MPLMSPVPDRAIVGAHLRTLDPACPFATAVAMRDGAVVAVGDDAEIRALCDAKTDIVDGVGLHIVPGLTDSHIHPLMSAIRTQGADLTQAATLDEVREVMAAERERTGANGWVRGWGASFEPFLATGIRGDLFNDAVGGQPTYIGFFDGHTAVANASALGIAGVDGPRQFEEASTIVCDERGVPTGELNEWAAMAVVQRVMPQPTEEERYRLFVDAFRKYNQVGLTGLHAMDGAPAEFDILRRMEENGDLTCRVILPLTQTPDTTEAQMRDHLRHRDEHGRRWRGGVAKFFMDGVIESGTAWLIEPDSHNQGGLPFWPDPEAYRRAVALFAGAGFQCVTHAVGDMAVRYALDSYKAAGAAPGIHHRIEHIEVVNDADLPRFAAEGVVASMQPLHMMWFEASGADTWSERLGDRRHGAFRARSLRDSGAIVALGSDWMVASYDPRVGMAWARLRRAGGRPDRAPIVPAQALTPLQALEGYTTESARTVGEANVAGRIAPGFRADLTAFAADPVDCDGDTLATLPVLLTVTDGEIVHRAEA
ncbi:MAG: amidohydrolase [Thermomicrobiales bacterium]|nr:amidohydrolase [Thermomicrobiales bacterium]